MKRVRKKEEYDIFISLFQLPLKLECLFWSIWEWWFDGLLLYFCVCLKVLCHPVIVCIIVYPLLLSMFWFIKKCKQIFVCFSLPTAVTKSLQWTVSIHKLFSCNLSSKLSKKSYSHPCISWDQCGISPASHSPSCFFADEGFYPTGFVFPSAQGQPLSWHLCAFPALRSAALSIQKLSTLCGVYTGHPCPFKNHLPCVLCTQVILVRSKTVYLMWYVYRSFLSVQKPSTLSLIHIWRCRRTG